MATVAGDHGVVNVPFKECCHSGKSPRPDSFGRLEGAVTVSHSPREPKRPEATYVRSANLRRVVYGASAVVSNREGLITRRWFKSSPRTMEQDEGFVSELLHGHHGARRTLMPFRQDGKQ